MANRPAAYKQQITLDCIEEWFQMTAESHYPDRPKREQSMSNLHYEYIRHVSDSIWTPEIGSHFGDMIVGYVDFARCMYRLGIVDMHPQSAPEYKQLESWRPSDEATMRWQPPIQTELHKHPDREIYE